jgi:hypothetical protein
MKQKNERGNLALSLTVALPIPVHTTGRSVTRWGNRSKKLEEKTRRKKERWFLLRSNDILVDSSRNIDGNHRQSWLYRRTEMCRYRVQ